MSEADINPAARLSHILARAHSHGETKGVLAAWAELLGVNEPDDITRQVEVTRLLGEMLGQLQLINEAAPRTPLKPNRYEAHLVRLREALSPARLPSEWKNVRQFLTPDTLLALDVLADTLPPDQTHVPQSAIDQILADLSSLEKFVAASELSADLAQFIYSQIDAIRKAVREYPVRGAVALRRAFERSVWEWQASEGLAKTPAEKRAVGRLHKTWIKAVAIGSAVVGFVAGAGKIADGVDKVLTKAPVIAASLGIELPTKPKEPKLIPAKTGGDQPTASHPATADPPDYQSRRSGWPVIFSMPCSNSWNILSAASR